MTCLWDRLPEDLADRIVETARQTVAASVIQRAYLKWTLWTHRQCAIWRTLRTHLGDDRVAFLEQFPHVRREWRTEGESWLCTEEDMLDLICREALDGLWGAASDRPLEEEDGNVSSSAASPRVDTSAHDPWSDVPSPSTKETVSGQEGGVDLKDSVAYVTFRLKEFATDERDAQTDVGQGDVQSNNLEDERHVVR